MRLRENFLRRRVARWRAWMAELTDRGRAVLVKQPTEAQVREKIRAFQALAAADRMSMPGAEYGDLSDLAFVMDLLADRDRQLAFYQKAPTVPMRAIDGEPEPHTWPYIDPPVVRRDGAAGAG